MYYIMYGMTQHAVNFSSKYRTELLFLLFSFKIFIIFNLKYLLLHQAK